MTTAEYTRETPRDFYINRRDEAIYLLMNGERLTAIDYDEATRHNIYWFEPGPQTWALMQTYRHGKPMADLRKFANVRRQLGDWEFSVRHKGDLTFPLSVRTQAASESEVA